MKHLFYLFTFLLFLSCSYDKSQRSVYFCGGQSNANNLWYKTIESRIKAVDPSAIVIHLNHPGESIIEWSWCGHRQENYKEDYNKIISSIPDNYIFSGIFWFQGESDYYEGYWEYYENRFYHLERFFNEDFMNEGIPIFMVTINGDGGNDGTQEVINVQNRIIEMNDHIYGISASGAITLAPGTSHMIDSEYIRLGNEISDVALNFLYQD